MVSLPYGVSLDFEFIAAIAFFIILTLFIYLRKSNVNLQKILFPFFYVAFYKTKLGLGFMDAVAKRFRILKIFGYAAIGIGFVGMAFIAFTLVQGLYNIFFVPEAPPTAGLVLPFPVKGAFYVPFFYWIISIFVIALVHEMSHGIMARFYDVKVKSSGFAFIGIILPVIPAAFVEPDEKSLRKKPKVQQLSVFAAGPFANIFLGGIILLIFILLVQPLTGSMIEEKGVIITDVAKGQPAEKAGMSAGELIREVDGVKISTAENFTRALKDKKPGEEIRLVTNTTAYSVMLSENPQNKTKGYIGIFVAPKTEIRKDFKEKYGEFTPKALVWLAGLLFWLFLLNLGIGLFNLVPIGPIDGGRMLQLLLHKMFGEQRGNSVLKFVSILFAFIIIVSITFAFMR